MGGHRASSLRRGSVQTTLHLLPVNTTPLVLVVRVSRLRIDSTRSNATLVLGEPEEPAEPGGRRMSTTTTLDRVEGFGRRESGADMGHVGVVGLAVMGENLARNIERNGFAPVVFNRTASRTEEFLDGPAKGTTIKAAFSIRDFVAALER